MTRLLLLDLDVCVKSTITWLLPLPLACPASLYPICVRAEALKIYTEFNFARPVRCMAGWQVSLLYLCLFVNVLFLWLQNRKVILHNEHFIIYILNYIFAEVMRMWLLRYHGMLYLTLEVCLESEESVLRRWNYQTHMYKQVLIDSNNSVQNWAGMISWYHLVISDLICYKCMYQYG